MKASSLTLVRPLSVPSAALALGAALVLGACEAPAAPAPCGPLPGHTIHVGQSATATACFEDPNQADTLAYTVASSDASVATAAISANIVTVTAVRPGIATITVTASDPEGLQGHARFAVTVPNRAPVVQGSIPPAEIPVGAAATIDVAGVFSEPDGQTLTYSARSADTRVATVTVNQQVIIVSAAAHGATAVHVTATDPGGLSATQSFTVTVPNRSPVARGRIPATTIPAGTTVTVELSPYFTDPDDDLLRYEASTSDSEVAVVSAVHEAVIVSSLARGAADVTVTVTDPGGLSASQSFTVTVPNRGPESEGAIPAVPLHVGDSITLDLAPFFSDPDGDTLAFAATIAGAALSAPSFDGGEITLRAVARGAATVTVTATDPGGLSASLAFQVNVPNRPPRTGRRLPAVEANLGYPAEIIVTPHFTDPDGDALTYRAATSRPAVATASVSGSTVTVTPVAPGTAVLAVTAVDPEGEEVSQYSEITVLPPDPGYFADDFATSASIRSWIVSRARASVRQGVLNLTNSRGDRRGQALRNHGLTEWSINTRLGRADANVSAALVMFMDHDRYTHYIVQIGSGVTVDGNDTNYRFLLYDADADSYSHPPGLQGRSGAIDDDDGEFSDITFSLLRRRLALHAGRTRLFHSLPLGSSLPVEITGYALVPWPHDARAGRTVLFDWFEMDGDVAGGAAQARLSGAAAGSVRELPPSTGGGPVRTREVPGIRRAPPGG